MNERSEIERALNVWFEDGPTRMPDRVVTVVADRIGSTRQRRRWRLQRRLLDMNLFVKVGAVVAAVVLIALVGYNLLPGTSPGVGGPAPESPSLSPSATPPALPDGRFDAGDYVMRTVPEDPMAFVITAPEGWTGFGEFFLGGPNQSGAPNEIGISVNHDPEVVTDPCDSTAHTPAPASSGPSVDDLVAALSARQDLEVSGVTDTESPATRASASIFSCQPTSPAITMCLPSRKACMQTGRRTAGGSGFWTLTARRPSSCSWITSRHPPPTGPLHRRPSIRSASLRSLVRPAREPRLEVPALPAPLDPPNRGNAGASRED